MARDNELKTHIERNLLPKVLLHDILVTNKIADYTQYVLSLTLAEQSELIGIPVDAFQSFVQLRFKWRSKHLVGHPAKLSPVDEVLLLFIYMRDYPRDCLLASLWQTSKQVISQTHERMLNWLYDELKPELAAHTLNWRVQNGGTRFFHSLITFVVDGSEQEVKSPGPHLANSLFFSGKKHRHTINLLIFVCLDGTVLHLSSSYPGSFNDNDIFKLESEKFLTQLETHERGFGDAGFVGLSDFQVFSTPTEQTPLRNAFSHFRIIVENVIANLKDWAICRERLRIPVDLTGTIQLFHRKAWTIASVLSNRYKEKRRR
jgi:hypothetical protein